MNVESCGTATALSRPGEWYALLYIYMFTHVSTYIVHTKRHAESCSV